MAPMETRIYNLGYHLVGFLDVLGQRDSFRSLTLPQSTENRGGFKICQNDDR